MRKLVLMCAILVGVVSVGNAMSEEGVRRILNNCVHNKDKSACRVLINLGGLSSVKQCLKDTCGDFGDICVMAEYYHEAIPYYEKAIALGDNSGYAKLGLTYLTLQDYYNAKKYYEIACKQDKGDEKIKAFSCNALGFLYYEGKGVRQDYAKVAKLLKKACDLKRGVACNDLGVLYAKGLGVRQNLSTAKQYYGKACDLGDQTGCDNYKGYNERGW